MIGEFALVMSVKEKKAVILAPGGRFLQIKNRDYRVGQRILIEPSLLSVQDRLYLTSENVKGKLHRFADRLKYKGLIILSCLSILVPTSAYAATKYVPWTYVSMDTGNVSIQYSLNARGEVLSTETFSEEAKEAMESVLPVRYEKVENAIDRVLRVIYPEDGSEMEEKEPVLIGISSRFGSGEKTVNSIAESMEQNRPVKINIEHLDWPETRNAQEEMLSIGQYGQKMENPELFEPDFFAPPASSPSLPGENETELEFTGEKEHFPENKPLQDEDPSAEKPEPNFSEPGGTGQGVDDHRVPQAPEENQPSGMNPNEENKPPEKDISVEQNLKENGTEPPSPAELRPQDEIMPPEGKSPEMTGMPDGVPNPDASHGNFSDPPPFENHR